MPKIISIKLKLPAIPDIELTATKASEIVAKHMELSEEQSAEINMALIEACLNAFEHSKTKDEIYVELNANPSFDYVMFQSQQIKQYANIFKYMRIYA